MNTEERSEAMKDSLEMQIQDRGRCVAVKNDDTQCRGARMHGRFRGHENVYCGWHHYRRVYVPEKRKRKRRKLLRHRERLKNAGLLRRLRRARTGEPERFQPGEICGFLRDDAGILQPIYA